MATSHIHRPSESREQALRRLAFQALTRGLHVYEYPLTREFYVSSYSQPDILHRVTRVSCDCRGFIQHGRCSHHALFLHHIGDLPPTTSGAARVQPSGPAVLCSQCGEPMQHVGGVTFHCRWCGTGFALNWQAADEIDRRLCDLSHREPDAFDWIERFLAPGGDAIPAGTDPDESPCREDVPDLLGLRNVNANDIAAVLIWRADADDMAARMVA